LFLKEYDYLPFPIISKIIGTGKDFNITKEMIENELEEEEKNRYSNTKNNILKIVDLQIPSDSSEKIKKRFSLIYNFLDEQ